MRDKTTIYYLSRNITSTLFADRVYSRYPRPEPLAEWRQFFVYTNNIVAQTLREHIHSFAVKETIFNGILNLKGPRC